MSKAEYVRAQPQVSGHHCHWPGCDRPVPPAMWGCKAHWFKLPARLRAAVWRTYRPGQEVTKTPSREYLDVAHEVQTWIAENAAPPPLAEREATTSTAMTDRETSVSLTRDNWMNDDEPDDDRDEVFFCEGCGLKFTLDERADEGVPMCVDCYSSGVGEDD